MAAAPHQQHAFVRSQSALHAAFAALLPQPAHSVSSFGSTGAPVTTHAGSACAQAGQASAAAGRFAPQLAQGRTGSACATLSIPFVSTQVCTSSRAAGGSEGREGSGTSAGGSNLVPLAMLAALVIGLVMVL